jgi:hypothetical protein
MPTCQIKGVSYWPLSAISTAFSTASSIGEEHHRGPAEPVFLYVLDDVGECIEHGFHFKSKVKNAMLLLRLPTGTV